MIQRVQTMYLILAILGMVALTAGMDVFTATYTAEEQFQVVGHGNTFGVQKDIFVKGDLTDANLHLLRTAVNTVDVQDEMLNVSTYKFPFYIFSGIILLLGIFTLMNFKNLKKQQGLARAFFILNLLTFVVSIFLYKSLVENILTDADGVKVVTELGTGFYGICIATAFSFMAILGIRRDVNLLKSIDRIR
ncbi:MAG TPA: DUF4293 family protein [Brumimicrobium sp.]|nr:DUF4293 family protein [Brumimicrobium sp.]